MPKSSKARGNGKPADGFPLWKHPSGRWCKKVRGRAHYYGKVADDPDGEAALEKWLAEKDDLLAGRTPRPFRDGLTVGDLANHFLTFKTELVNSGELAPRTFQRYHANSALIVGILGKRRLVDDLAADDFRHLRSVMASSWGPVALANEIQMARSVFRYGYEAGLIDRPVRFGPGFKKPSAKTLRQARTKNGPRMFTPAQIVEALDHAKPNMKAMILLAINGGLGNTDLALLPTKAVDLKEGWMDYPRHKTAIPRRIPLWPETVSAIKAALTVRCEPKSPDDSHLLFIGPRGASYVEDHKGRRVTGEWQRTAKKAAIEGRSFYDLRRTFQTIGEGARDLVAVQSVMGHAPATGDMSAIYRQTVDDERLKAVVDHVHAWLYADAKGGQDE